jgi:hypothetical protein
MTDKKSAGKATKKSASKGFTAEEREAMRERAKELKAARGGKGNDESAVLEKLASVLNLKINSVLNYHYLFYLININDKLLLSKISNNNIHFVFR